MKPMFEKVLPTPNCSWRFWLYEINGIEFNWHYHPEYEIALTLNSEGQRFVGDNIERYSGSDMALLGPHLPHTWCAPESSNGINTIVYVAQIPASWLETLAFGMPDLGAIKSLLERSRRGLKFSTHTVEKSAILFAAMVKATPSQRFIYLMQILQLMVEDSEAAVLSSPGYSISMAVDPSIDKLDKVIRYLHKNYTNNLMAEDVAKLVHMSTNYFHRFIKQRTEQTFTELVNQLRISKACSLLISSQMPISTISDTCGFNNISNFNRRFLQFKGMKPRDFRKLYAGRHLLT